MTRILGWKVAALLAFTMPTNLAASAQAAPKSTIQHSQNEPIALQEVPQPDLTKVDPPVREQIEEAQATLAAILASTNASGSRKARAFGSLGQLYQAYGFDEAALACYENAVALEPESFRWRYYAGYLQQQTANVESAAKQYQLALRLRPSDKVTMLRLANVELSRNHLEEAKRWFTKAMALRGPSAAALAGLGKVAFAEHQYPEALKYFTEALAQDPQASAIHYQLAMTYRELGDVNKMQENLRVRGNNEPTIDDPLLEEIQGLKQGKVALLERGSRAIRENRVADAIAAYRELVRLYPSDPIAYSYFGVALAKSGKSREALAQYAHALELDPYNATVHYDMGSLSLESGNEQMAITHFREAARLDPGFAPAHFQIANLFMRQGKDEEAAREYSMVVALDPQNAFARLMQAMAYIHVGAHAKARSLLEEAAVVVPHDPDIANALARILAAAPEAAVGDKSRALRIIEPLVESGVGDVFEETATLAMALAGVGRYKEAAASQRELIERLEKSNFEVPPYLREDLARYEKGSPCRMPWHKDDPVFVPVYHKQPLQMEMKSRTKSQ